MITKPLVMTDAKIVEQKINSYFEQQDKAGKPYTMIGLAIGLGLNHRKMLDVYANLDFEQAYLDKYQIKYIVIGSKEYEAYPGMETRELLDLGEIVVSQNHHYLIKLF